MQACRRLVQNIHGASGTAARKLRCQLNALCFAAAQRRRCLSQMDVAKAYVLQHCQLAVNTRLVLEEFAGFAHSHIKNLRNGFALIMHLQRIAVVACTVADFAGNVNVRQKVHFYLIHAVALAGLAASSLDVKAEAACLIASQFGLVGLAEELTDKIKDAGIGCGIGARCASDWGLVDVDYFIRIFYAFNAVMLRSTQTRTVELSSQSVVENIIYQG